jgi:membrane protease YdiL (CAAX protease family)
MMQEELVIDHPEEEDPSTARATIILVVGIVAAVLASALDMVVPPAGIPAALVVTWLTMRMTGGGWRTLGMGRPRSWAQTIALGLGFGILWQLSFIFLVGPLMEASDSGPDLSRFEAIKGNLQMLAVYIGVSWTTAGFGEEIVWRGLILGGLGRLLGGGRAAWSASLVIMAVLFGALHFYQGAVGMALTGITGLVLGILYLATRRNLWVTIIAHGTMNTVAFLLLYFGFEL